MGRLRRSLVHFILGKGVTAVLALGLLLVLVRALDTADYGFYIASQAALELTLQLSSVGLIAAAQRYLPELRAGRHLAALARFIRVICFSRLATLMLLCALLYPLIGSFVTFFDLHSYQVAISIYLLVIIAEGLARYLDEVLDALMLQGVSQVSMLLRTGLRLGLLLVALGGSDGAIEIKHWVMIELLASCVGCLWSVAWITAYVYRCKRDESGPLVLDLPRYARYASKQYIAATFYMLAGLSSVKLIAARMLPVTQYAAFGFSASFAAMLQRYLPMFLLVRVLRPLFVAARQREDYRTRLPAMGALVFKLNVFALLPLAVVFAVASDSLAMLLTGGRYPEVGGYLVAFLCVLLAQALRAVVSLIAQAMENSGASLIGTMLGLFGLGAGIWAAQTHGAYGFCFGLVASELIFVAYVLRRVVLQGLLLSADWRGYLHLALAGAVATAAGIFIWHFLEARAVLGLAMLAALVLGLFLLVAFLFKPFTAEERATLNRLLKRNVFVW